jgi:hypothetical protein
MPILTLALVVVMSSSAGLALADADRTASGDDQVGKLSIHHADNLRRGRSATKGWYLSTARGEQELVFAGRPPVELIGAVVRVRGRRDGGSIQVPADGLQPVSGSTTSATTAGAVSGNRRVAVILFNFANDTQQPYTADHARGVAFGNANSVAAYYSVNSWGGLTLSGDVFGWVTIPHTNASCAYATWASAATTAARVDASAYDHVVYAFPQTTCGWAGLASMPGKSSWLNGPMAMSLRLMAHELGHNLGTHHAGEYRCTEGGAKVPLAADASHCSTGEYGDPFSVMGGSARHEHTSFSRGNFGWLAPANTFTATQTGDYLLAPIEFQTSTGVTALRVARTSSSYLTLEFRQPDQTPFDNFATSSALASGIVIRLTAGSYSTRTQTWMVWARPSATYCECNAPLRVGESLTDPMSGVTFTVTSVSPAGAVVHIAFGGSSAQTPAASPTASPTLQPTPQPTPTPTTNPTPAATRTASPTPQPTLTPTTDVQLPSAPGNLTASVARGRKVVLSWSSSSDNVGVAGYRVFRDGIHVGTAAAAGFVDSPGGKKGSTYRYHVIAFDAAGNVSATSNVVAARP